VQFRPHVPRGRIRTGTEEERTMRGERTGWTRWLGLGRAAPAGPWELALDETRRLPRGGVVRVEAGQVVVTREGDPIDHVLAPGDALELASRGRAVAWALGPSRVVVEARNVPGVFARRRRSPTASSPSRSEARPSAAKPWPAPRPS
jgi:hypothetical protein